MTLGYAAGLQDGKLAPCPDAPNCVSSDQPGRHATAPFKLAIPPGEAWQALERVLSELPRVNLVTRTDQYIHAEFVSTVFRFVDDVELSLRPSEGLIAVRSASRVGYYDFGANRRRVEALRRRMQARGAVE